MRVLMLSWRGPRHPRAGGAELYTLRILAGLARRGHSATWLCDAARAERVDGVRVVPAGPVPAVYAAGAAYLLARARHFDVVVDQINVLGFLTPLCSPIPHVALIHQLAREVWRRDAPPPLRALGPAAESAMLRLYRAAPFVTVSDSTLADLRAAGWRGPGAVAPNGVDRLGPEGGAAKEPVPTLVFLGRWQARSKRLDHALAAFAAIRHELPDARLWVLGRGRPTGAAPPGVAFFAGVGDGERDRLLARAWLLVATSVREGWGRMVLEAAAMGTPAAVYEAPGLAEAGRALGATVVAPSPPALASAAAGLLASPQRLRAMGAEARRRARGFTWDAAVDVWEQVLREACRPNDPAGGGGGRRR